MRLTKEELEEVKKKYNVDELYSWSKITCLPYEYFLKYIKKIKPDNDNSAYAPLGGIAHDILEKYYSGTIKYEEMAELFDDGWITNIDIADLKFDRCDEDRNNKIKDKYKYDIEQFFVNHISIKDEMSLEQFMAIKIGEYVLQGYVDAIKKDKNDNYTIIDWKTSTKYAGKNAEEKCGQLVVYALGLMQQGVPMDKIKICWNFLKYCTVQYQQKNGAIKSRDIERIELGKSLKANAKVWLKEFGYNEDLDYYLNYLEETNDINVLPKEVRNKYVISDCYVYVELTNKLISKWEKDIIGRIKDFKFREKEYEKCNHSTDKMWWESDEEIKKESYYFANLCGFSANLYLPYKEYLENLEKPKDNNLFTGVGNDTCDTEIIENKVEESEDDLSWLNDL